MAAAQGIVDRLGFDPESVPCRNCWMDAGQPCHWAPVRNPSGHLPLYHAERLEDAEQNAALAAEIAGTAPDPQAWHDAVRAAAEQLV